MRRDPVFNRTKHCRQSISRKTFPLIFPWQQNQKKVEEKIVEFFSVLAVEDKLFASVLCACCLFSFPVWPRYGRGGEGKRGGILDAAVKFILFSHNLQVFFQLLWQSVHTSLCTCVPVYVCLCVCLCVCVWVVPATQ